MDVRCPQCQTLYELDERQTAKGPVTLKCSRCQHVFRFESDASLSQENQRRWMVNSSRDGAIHYLNDFTDLHRWIMEKKVRAKDTISRTGDAWVEIGSIPEFAPIFIVVESISDLTGSTEDSYIATRVREGTPAAAPTPAAKSERPAAAEAAPEAERPTATGERERVETNVQFPNATNRPKSPPKSPAKSPSQSPPQSPPGATPASSVDEPTRRDRPERLTPGELPPRPGGKRQVDTGERSAIPAQPTANQPADDTIEDAWSMGQSPVSEPERPLPPEEFVEPASGSKASLFVILLVLLLGGGGAAVYVLRPDLIEKYVGPMNAEEAVVALGDSAPDSGGTPDTGVATTDETEPTAIVATAHDAAATALAAREGELFDGAVFAAHLPLGAAIDQAISTSAKAAEGGLTDERLAEARRALERGRLRKAEELFESVLEFEPRNANAVSGLGFIYLEQSNPTRAAKEFRRAVDLGGGDGTAYIGLGTAERQLNNPQGAYNAYDLYLGRFPRGEKASIARYQLQQLRKQLGM